MEKKRIFLGVIGLFALIFLLYPSSPKIEKKPDWKGVFRQGDSYSCGYCCLKMIFNYYSVKVIDANMRNELLDEKVGTNMLLIKDYASKYGINSDGLELSYEQLKSVTMPVIVRIKEIHFVVLDSIEKDSVFIRNPNKGRQVLFKDDFIDTWDGKCLIFSKN